MFSITLHQYELIMQQAQSCYPQETGGILGGKEGMIMGVLPVANLHPGDRTGTFGISHEDLLRGKEFLAKHGLEYYGVYHTHPKGVPYPSEQDLSHNERFLFIIGLADRYNPELRAWQVQGKTVTPAPIQVLDNQGFARLNLQPNKPKLSENVVASEMERLHHMIDDIIEQRIDYPILDPPNWEDSNFSTIA